MGATKLTDFGVGLIHVLGKYYWMGAFDLKFFFINSDPRISRELVYEINLTYPTEII